MNLPVLTSQSQTLTRRQAVCLAAAGLVAAGSEPLLAQSKRKPLDIGTAKDFEKPGIYDNYLKTDKIVIFRKEERLMVANASCTHRGCALLHQQDQLLCPCHASTFDADGKPTYGPALASLLRYGVRLNEQGRIVVDKSQLFGERQWNEAAAFVKISPAST